MTSEGTVHKLPSDLRKAIEDKKKSSEAWQSLTPIARNEFICWVEDAKKSETRNLRINRTRNEIAQGKRRPCCWIGCIHRKDKAISPSIQEILAKRNKKQ